MSLAQARLLANNRFKSLKATAPPPYMLVDIAPMVTCRGRVRTIESSACSQLRCHTDKKAAKKVRLKVDKKCPKKTTYRPLFFVQTVDKQPRLASRSNI
jgi:hypothetical protein